MGSNPKPDSLNPQPPEAPDRPLIVRVCSEARLPKPSTPRGRPLTLHTRTLHHLRHNIAVVTAHSLVEHSTPPLPQPCRCSRSLCAVTTTRRLLRPFICAKTTPEPMGAKSRQLLPWMYSYPVCPMDVLVPGGLGFRVCGLV
jgi:hypothetical protein